MENLKEFFVWITHTKLGWLLISFMLLGVFGIIDESIEGDWAMYAMIAPALYIVCLILVMIAYAWVINPLRERREMKQDQQKQTNKS